MFFLNAPKFWSKPAGSFLNLLNIPAKAIHEYFFDKPYKTNAKSFVIAVGGLTVGGAGKTPVALALAAVLRSLDYSSLIGLRGYGRSAEKATLVNRTEHSFKDVGDEALLMSQYAPVAVSANRIELDNIAFQNGYDCLILDDGWMQRYVRPNLKVLVIDGQQSLGNGLLFPLGPLRLGLELTVSLADLIIFLNEDRFDLLPKILAIKGSENIVRGRVKSDFSGISKNIIAFSGLGCNEKFFESLNGLNVLKTYGFPDHYPYSADDILKILDFANKMRLKTREKIDIVTTEKDYQRLSDPYRKQIKFIPIKVNF